MRKMLFSLQMFLVASAVSAETVEPVTAKALASHVTSNDRDIEVTQKKIDDLLWFFKVGDVAAVDKVELTGKPHRTKIPTWQGAGQPLIIPAYFFTQKNLRGKAPLID